MNSEEVISKNRQPSVEGCRFLNLIPVLDITAFDYSSQCLWKKSVISLFQCTDPKWMHHDNSRFQSEAPANIRFRTFF